MISQVIAAARRAGRKIGICGQAPSDYPEFAEFLVEQGIDSISLNPDAVIKTTVKILEIAGRRDVGEATAPALVEDAHWRLRMSLIIWPRSTWSRSSSDKQDRSDASVSADRCCRKKISPSAR